jgi:predicted membrane metal-binding protein
VPKPSTTHEDLARTTEVQGPSDRSFGITFAVVFVIIGLWPLLGDGTIRDWALIVAGIFLVAALARPRILAPLNAIWLRFGLLLHRVVSPVVLGLVYWVTVVPTGLIMRALGKRPLQLEFDPDTDSYWLERDPPGPPAGMENQF